MAEDKRRLEAASQRFDNGEVDDEDAVEETPEERPTKAIQPKYKIVHSFPTDIGDAWGGYSTS